MKAVTLTLIVLAVLLGETTRANAEDTKVNCPHTIVGVNFYRTHTWKWQVKQGVTHTHSSFMEKKSRSCAFNNWLGKLWRNRAHKAHLAYVRFRSNQRRSFSALYRKWECIHKGEGAWNSNTGNGYYGGLQMDWSFMRHYGSEFLSRYGTADRWPVYDQLVAAERAYQSGRGYYPWPHTARACRLI